ncbi:PqiC family protein [Methylovulum miyakonense]|uniref:PqiC family protein n=1 Tax=Methylovulum miyakonense TaxID=645578 RepID=UPI0003AAB1B8|nr:PqiC family protein [Methylovulum miyakonense]
MSYPGAMKSPAVFLWVMLMSTLVLDGCMHTGGDKPIQFYRLTAGSGLDMRLPAATKPLDMDMTVGLGPIHIPEYLGRPQMMVAVTEHQYRLSEEHRWAEPLEQNISLALFQALPGLLGTDRIVRYPWPQRQLVDYQIGIDILEFNIDASAQSRLIAQWSIKRKGQAGIDRRSVIQFPASTTDYEAMVRAQSQCLGKLAQEIAVTLRQNQ